MLVGCIRTAIIRLKPGGPLEKIKYCLDCVRPHEIIYCKGQRKLHKPFCSYHIDK